MKMRVLTLLILLVSVAACSDVTEPRAVEEFTPLFPEVVDLSFSCRYFGLFPTWTFRVVVEPDTALIEYELTVDDLNTEVAKGAFNDSLVVRWSEGKQPDGTFADTDRWIEYHLWYQAHWRSVGTFYCSV